MYPQLSDETVSGQSQQGGQSETSPYYYQNGSTHAQQISIEPHQPLAHTTNEDIKSIFPKSAKFIVFGSILLFVCSFFITLFLLADIICGAQYYEYLAGGKYILSSHNSPAESVAKTLLMLVNLSLMIASGVLGIVSVRNPYKTKYSLLHVVCLSIGMVVFLSEIITVNVSFFTTFTNSPTGTVFFPILIVFSVLSVSGLACCCACCVSGCCRYRNISRTTSI